MSRHAALAALSLSTVQDDALTTRLSAMPAAMREEIERQRGEAQATATRSAATQVISLMEGVEASNTYERKQIRSYRAAMRELKARMDRRDRALAYGLETQNFIPLLVANGESYYTVGQDVMTRDEWTSLSVIPESWSPAASDSE